MGYAVKLGTDPNYTPTPRYGCIFGIPRGVGLNTYVPVRLNTYVPQCRIPNTRTYFKGENLPASLTMGT